MKGLTSTKNCSIQIPELEGLSNFHIAEKIGDHFAKVSNLYKPVDLSLLPSYLPAPAPLQVTEEQVFKKLSKLKNTKSTYPIDLPSKLRNEFSYFLTLPLKDIINSCLEHQTFPALWKVEYVTPLEKVQTVQSYSQ